MENMTVFQLAQRLNEILKEITILELEKIRQDNAIKALEDEWNAIVYELWDRIPSLQEDIDLQPKTKKKVR